VKGDLILLLFAVAAILAAGAAMHGKRGSRWPGRDGQ
jgi:hypothetical protein